MMPVLTFGELNNLILASFFFGLGIGFIYEVFRMIRLFFCIRRRTVWKDILLYHLPVFILDVLFCLLLTVSGVILFSSYGGGQARLAAIFSLGFGWLLWHESVGRFTVTAGRFIKKTVSVFFRWLYLHTVGRVIGLLKLLCGRVMDSRRERLLIRYDRKTKAALDVFLKLRKNIK